MQTDEFLHWTNDQVTTQLERLVPFPVRMGRGWHMDREPILTTPRELSPRVFDGNPLCVSHFHHVGDGHLLDLWVDCVTMKVVDWLYVPGLVR